MHAPTLLFAIAALRAIGSFALPIPVDSSDAIDTVISAAVKRATTQSKAVQSAADAFASDVATVSSSLNGIGGTTNTAQIKKLATAANTAELDEDSHRAVLFKAAGTGSAAASANQKIVKNTPIVLKGLQSIMKTPTTANAMKQLQTIESARFVSTWLFLGGGSARFRPMHLGDEKPC
jgi:hypothetical protein